MRIRVIQMPSVDQLDGIDLRRFVVGQKYDVANQLGALLLAEGWAEPLGDDEPALLVPFSENDPFSARVLDANHPPNLVREMYPPYVDEAIAAVADLERRRRPRHPKI